MNIKLTVFFDDPFWVGVFEKTDGEMLQISRVVFGSEPRDCEVYTFILKNYYKLVFSRPIRIDKEEQKVINPKKLKRIVKKETSQKGVGTKAQQAMKLEYEKRKEERKKLSNEKREELERAKFKKRQEKKKKKKKGH